MNRRAAKVLGQLTIFLKSLSIGCWSVSIISWDGTPGRPSGVIIKDKHTCTPVCGKCWFHQAFLQTVNFQSGWRHDVKPASHPLLFEHSVFLTHYESPQLSTIQSLCVDGCHCVFVSEEHEERGLRSYSFGVSDEASPAALCLHCGSVAREHQNHPCICAAGDSR